MTDAAPQLILASASQARRAMLEAAGLSFAVIPAGIDEEAIRDTMMSESACVDGDHLAAVLAAEKALSVSKHHPDALVIGSDQVLALGTRLFAKANSLTEARHVLDTLRGRTHELFSAVALAEAGAVTWHAVTRAELTMRAFSDEFLSRYMEQNSEVALRSVGAYAIEGHGIHLFDTVQGDHFTILGLPLLPLLQELRRKGVLSS